MAPVSKVDEKEEDPPSCEDVICLNVADTIMHVKRGTLTSGGGLLEAMFSGRWSLKTVDSNGVLFLDHRPEVFRLLLDCLREKATESSPYYRGTLPVVPSEMRLSFYQLVEYYGLTNYLYETCLCCSSCAGKPTGGPCGQPLVVAPPMALTTDDWFQGFLMNYGGHHRTLIALHLKFGGTCRWLEIGWAKLCETFKLDIDNQVDRIVVVFEHGSTTARIVRTNKVERRGQPALTSRVLSTFSCALGDTTAVSLLCLNKTTYQILVNGECVVDTKSLEDPSFPENWSNKMGQEVPFIGLEGTASLEGVELGA